MGFRFCRKESMPSFRSFVLCKRTFKSASRANPCGSVRSIPLYIASFKYLEAIGPPSVMDFANERLSFFIFPLRDTLFIRPIFSASSTLMVLPVRIKSLAQDFPTNRGNRCVPPSQLRMPLLISVNPNWMLGWAILMSRGRANSSP